MCGSTHSPHPALGAVRLSSESGGGHFHPSHRTLDWFISPIFTYGNQGAWPGREEGSGAEGLRPRKTAPVTLSAGIINLSGKRSWLCSEVCPQNVRSATQIPQRLFKDCWVYLARFCSTVVWQKNEIATILFSVSCFYDESSTYPRTETR